MKYASVFIKLESPNMSNRLCEPVCVFSSGMYLLMLMHRSDKQKSLRIQWQLPSYASQKGNAALPDRDTQRGRTRERERERDRNRDRDRETDLACDLGVRHNTEYRISLSENHRLDLTNVSH